MAAKLGHVKSGGRKKGSVNKETKTLQEICAKHGVNPFEAMVILAASELDPDKRFDKLDRLLPYLEAKRANVNVGIDPEKNRIEVIIKRWGE